MIMSKEDKDRVRDILVMHDLMMHALNETESGMTDCASCRRGIEYAIRTRTIHTLEDGIRGIDNE